MLQVLGTEEDDLEEENSNLADEDMINSGAGLVVNGDETNDVESIVSGNTDTNSESKVNKPKTRKRKRKGKKGDLKNLFYSTNWKYRSTSKKLYDKVTHSILYF